MDLALFALALPVCIADITTFVIPNIYTKILLSVALIHLTIFGFGPARQIAVSLAILSLLLMVGTGMGDMKLLALILLTHSFNATEYIVLVFLLGMVHIVGLTAFQHAIPVKIPLAPSIFIGLATYLAAR
jgi:prepilin signal peptidase PulO-like enzyme (type II secretory pathway)